MKGTLRQGLEQHRVNPACASCHARIDPLGFVLENFDAIGRYREQEGKSRIDASARLPNGRELSGATELKRVLVENKEQFPRCLAEKLLTYALGRAVEDSDGPIIDGIIQRTKNDGYQMQTLIREIIKSDAFCMRRDWQPGEQSP